jgi:hypothetical protein
MMRDSAPGGRARQDDLRRRHAQTELIDVLGLQGRGRLAQIRLDRLDPEAEQLAALAIPRGEIIADRELAAARRRGQRRDRVAAQDVRLVGADRDVEREAGLELLTAATVHPDLGQHKPGGGGEGRDEVERAGALAAIVAAAGSLAVDRHQIDLFRPDLPDPVREGGGEERRVDPVHQDGKPALTRDAMRVGLVLAEEVEMRRAPGRDVLVVVAVGDGAADDQQQDLGQRVQDPPHVARVFHLREVIEQRGEARLPGRSRSARSWAAPNQGRRIDSAKLPAANCHLSSEPWSDFGAD